MLATVFTVMTVKLPASTLSEPMSAPKAGWNMLITLLAALLFFAPALHAQAQILESVPVHVHPQRLKLQQIIALAAFHVGADVADTVSTTGWERRCPRCFESGFPLGLAVRKPTVTEMVMLGSGEVTLAALLASKMQRSRHTWIRSMFWLPQSAMITTHSLAVAHNLSLKHF